MESNKILVGEIVGAQGLRGEVRVQTYTESPTDFAGLKIIFWPDNCPPTGSAFASPTPPKGGVIEDFDCSPLGGSRRPGVPTQSKIAWGGQASVGGQIKFVRALPNSSVIIAKIDGVDDRNAADGLRGTQLFVDRGDLPPLGTNEYYQADLIGMKIAGTGNTVAAVQNYGAGDILELDTGEMVPFTGATVDLERREITLKAS